MATRQKNQIAKAVTSFRSIYDQDPDFLPGVLGLATAYMMEKDEVPILSSLYRSSV